MIKGDIIKMAKKVKYISSGFSNGCCGEYFLDDSYDEKEMTMYYNHTAVRKQNKIDDSEYEEVSLPYEEFMEKMKELEKKYGLRTE